MNDDPQAGNTLIAKQERDRDRLSGLELDAACRSIELPVDSHADGTNLLAIGYKQGPDEQLVRKERQVLAIEVDAHTKNTVRHRVGDTGRCYRTNG
ncbi:hypothetical protein [Mesorhizobium sp.]|uniref:hypothetical protein n=1 Tax=Mesorhizobium sp. TaxID=1871066 RepID=UPI00257A2D2F|nr:hypothetical protein [Mesorhizobium sp.]